MNSNTDELAALREMFQDLTADQPPAPLWRYQAVRRRLVRHRWLKLARWSALLAATGATATAGAILPALSGSHTAPRAVPRWALPWPDHRNGSVPQRVLDNAVNAWRHTSLLFIGGPAPVLRKVIWYVGQTAGQEVIVAFEADTGTGRYLVVGLATASDVMRGNPGWTAGSPVSSWVLWDAPVPARRAGLAIGLNIEGQPAAAGFPDNWIMVLAPPNVRTITWRAPTVSGLRTGRAATERGLAIADTGQVTGRVLLTGLIADHSNVLRRVRYVSVPGNVVQPGEQPSDVPQLAEPATLSPPRAFKPTDGGAGQGAITDLITDQPVRRTPVLFARCYGPEPLRIYLSNRSDGIPSRLVGVIACDSGQHELVLSRGPLRSPISLFVKTSDLTAWRYSIGSLP